MPAENVPMIRGIRDQSVLELVAFMKTKIDGKSLTLLAGDFNILRYPLNPFYLSILFGRSPDFIHHLSIIEEEYDDLLRTLSSSFTVEDCWVRDNQSTSALCITYGDSHTTLDGKKLALDQVCTHPDDFYAENCLDYIFQI